MVIEGIGIGDTLIVSGGTYGCINVSTNNITIRSVKVFDPNYTVYSGTVILDGSGYSTHVVNVKQNTTGVCISGDILLKDPDILYKSFNSGIGTSCTLNGVSILRGGITARGNLNLNRIKHDDCDTTYAIDVAHASAVVNVLYSQIANFYKIRANYGTLNIDNSLLVGGLYAAIDMSGSNNPICNIRNSMVVACRWKNSKGPVLINMSNGTMTAFNSLLLPDGKNGNTYNWIGLIDEGGNI